MTHHTHREGVHDDLRVQRTHKLILDALIELTIQKGFSNITVSDITRHAGINRATFYRHYRDKFDLIDQYAQAVYELVDSPEDEPATSKRPSEKPPSGMVRMFEHIRANARFYHVMLSQNGDPAFVEKVRQYVEKRLRHSLPEALPDDENLVDFYLGYMSSGSVWATLWWLEHDLPYSPEEMAALAHRISATNLQVMMAQRPPGDVLSP